MKEKIIKIILNEAKKAYKKGEVPVGAAIIKNNKLISKSYNNRQKKCDVTGHAEIKSIIKASKKLGDWRLNECELYVTLEPCDMCRKVIEESRIKKVYYLKKAINNNKNHLASYKQINNNDDEYDKMFENFFKNLR